MNLAMLWQLAKNPIVWVGVLGVMLLLQTARVEIAQSQRDTAEFRLEAQSSQIVAAAKASASCRTAVEKLQARMHDMLLQRQLDRERVKTVLKESEVKAEAAVAKAADERRRRDALWRATQTCEGMRVLRLDTGCDDIADRLRERSGGGHRVPDGGSARASTG